MRVIQIAETIIGEGSFAGEPCLMVRLGGCNLSCSWCDTPNARRGGHNIPFPTLIEKGLESPYDWILLTGGEPLLQKNTPKLVQCWAENGKKILVETNGSLDIRPVLINNAFISMDIKPPSSGCVNSLHKENLNLLRSVDQIKIVIADQDDFDWAKKLINQLSTKATIVIQPAMRRISAERLAKMLLKEKLKARMGIQLHKLLKLP